jgi:hypothetical protein
VEMSLQMYAATMFWLEVAVNINSTLPTCVVNLLSHRT